MDKKSAVFKLLISVIEDGIKADIFILRRYIENLQTTVEVIRYQMDTMYRVLLLLSKHPSFQNHRVPQNPRLKPTDYWTTTFPSYTDSADDGNSFSHHFRIKRSTFNFIVSKMQAHPIYRSENAPVNKTPVYRQIATALWRLANHTTIRQMEQTLGFSQGSIANFTDRFCIALIDTFGSQIVWPKSESALQVADGFANTRRRAGKSVYLTKAIGAVDGSHIRIKVPTEYRNVYYNRKGYASVVLMAAADHTEKFTFIYIGECGSVHDSSVLQRSEMWTKFTDQTDTYFPDNTYMLGDLAFPLTPFLMTPFKENETKGNPKRRLFNYILSSHRMCIERAFGRLKQRWRILLGVEANSLRRIARIIQTCCILHNMCQSLNDEIQLDAIEDDDTQDMAIQVSNSRSTSRRDRGAVDKRDTIVEALWNMAQERGELLEE